MRLGNKIIIIFITYYSSMFLSFAEEKISTSSLLNVEQIKPSFEELDEDNENISAQNLQKKITSLKSSQAILIGLDKITAKSSEIVVKLNESKQFGPLEIKILKYIKVK